MKQRKIILNKKTCLIAAAVLVVCVCAVAWMITRSDDTSKKPAGFSPPEAPAEPKPIEPAPSAATPAPAQPAEEKKKTFDKNQYSRDDPGSLWVVVNKRRPLQPKNHVPSGRRTPDVPLRVPGNESMQLRSEAATAVEAMTAAAKKAGVNIMLSSGYRSYSYQVTLYNDWVRKLGQAAADQQSARPGFSEHQTGLAVDFIPTSRECELEECFGDRPEGKWLAANAHTYGFILRYPKNKTSVTGYQSEPWHFRFVGVALAGEMHRSGATTLEEFFGLPAAPDYN